MKTKRVSFILVDISKIIKSMQNHSQKNIPAEDIKGHIIMQNVQKKLSNTELDSIKENFDPEKMNMWNAN